MKAKKGLIIISILTSLLGAGLGGLSYVTYQSGNREFVADGFILKPNDEVNVMGAVNEQYYFSQGDTYREKYGTNILFTDSQGIDVNIPSNQFVHYNDGSLGSFTKGVIMDISKMSDDQFGYYNLTKNTILVKNGESYDITSRGEVMSLKEFVWKISDTDYLFVSPEVTFKLNETVSVTLPDYAQIKYVDDGIVRIVHQQGTYQTISAETTLVSQAGAELNLVSQNFMQDGEAIVSLAQMALNDDRYETLDEDADTPEIKIPTFQVVNGKNGAPGATGADGEDGADGEAGEMGEVGEDGLSGSSGESGAAGSSGENGDVGNDGEKGTVGNNGQTGYDGADGATGTDATNAYSVTGVVGEKQNARPTVSMESDTYAVTPAGITMKLNFEDINEAVEQGTLQVKLYDRATMQEVAIDTTYGSKLESQGSVMFNQSNLSPDTEYVLVVSGEYYGQTDDDESKREADFYTKVFKTDALGVELKVASVTENSVTLRSEVSGSALAGYTVVFYRYDTDGNMVKLATYANLNTSRNDLVFDATDPATRELQFDTDGGVKSNSNYYAKITDVSLTSGALVDSADTEVSILTLKQKPLVSLGGSTTEPFANYTPLLTANEKTRTITFPNPNFVDKDNGIKTYKYQLFSNADYATALTAGTLDGLAPAYEAEYDTAREASFQLAAGDTSSYVGRIVVTFDDNTKTTEYATMMSVAVYLTGSTFPVVSIVPEGTYTQLSSAMDTLSGYVKVTDSASMINQYVNAANPIVLTFYNEYEDLFTLRLETAMAGMGDTNTKYYYFHQDGLRRNTPYTLSVSGPVDANCANGLEDGEKLTYLSGTRATTRDTSGIRAVFSEGPNSSAAFAIRVNFTSSEGADAETIAYDQYEVKALENLEFQLVQEVEGVEVPIGTAPVKDIYDVASGYADGNHKSIFYEGGWIDDSVSISYPTTGTLKNGYKTSSPNTGGDSKLVLTPASFGKSDSIFTGGEYTLRLVSAVDYTKHKNEVPMETTASGASNQITFTIAKRHLRVEPNDQINVNFIYNGDAVGAKHDASLSNDTPVGLTIQGRYLNTDVDSVTYIIYKIPTTMNLDPTDAASITLYDDAGQAAPAGNMKISEMLAMGAVHIATVTENNAKAGLGGISGNGSIPATDVYFVDYAGFERGCSYVVTYEVQTHANGGIVCNTPCNGTVGDLYPSCMYNAATEAIPVYRSATIAIPKQTPEITRYMSTTTNDSVTWKYKIVDPDKAIVGTTDNFNYKLLVCATIDGTYTASGTLSAARATYATDYAPLTFSKSNYSAFVNGKYYCTEFEIEAVAGTVTTQTSQPVKFVAKGSMNPSTNEDNKLYAVGRFATPTTPAADKDTADTTYEKTILNMGGYLYRITLRGSDINKYAAFRVTFTDTANDSKKVVFDPVYPEVKDIMISDGSKSYPYGYLNIDTGALKVLKDSGTASAKVTIEGYYSTGVSGVDEGYAGSGSDFASTKVLSSETPYLLRVMDTTMALDNDYYIYNGTRYQQAAVSSAAGILRSGSLFVAGKKGIASSAAFDFVNNKLNQMYFISALASGGDGAIVEREEPFELDDTGMLVNSIYYGGYITVEKAALQPIGFKLTDRDIVNLSDIFPGIHYEMAETSQGATSFVTEFDLKGVGASGASAVYAEVYEQQADGVYHTVKTTKNVVNTKTYITVVDSTDPSVRIVDESYFTQASYGSNNLAIDNDGGTNFSTTLRVQGLLKGHNYKVKLFTYDASGNKMYLYDVDNRATGWEYQIRTKDHVTVSTSGPIYTYESYTDKKIQFGFAIQGDEGTGLEVRYRLYDADGNPITGETLLPPIGSGALAYYSNVIADNQKMSISNAPGFLTVGAKYKLHVNVYADGGSMLQDDADYIIPFTVRSYESPTTRIQLSNYVINAAAGTKGIRASVSVTDYDAITRALSGSDLNTDAVSVSIYQGTTVDAAHRVDTKTINLGTKRTMSNGKTAIYSGSTLNFSTGLIDGEIYTVVATYYADLNNNGVIEDGETREAKSQIQLSGSSNASLGATASDIPAGTGTKSSSVSVVFTNFENFQNVRKFLITVFKDGVQVDTTTKVIASEITSSSYTIDWSWNNVTTAGIYEILIQYQDASGTMLGNGTVNAVVVKTP